MFSAYPLFLSLKEKKCLIVGFGKVGRRKLRGLLPCNPRLVRVFEKKRLASFDPSDRALLHKDNIKFFPRSPSPREIADSFLVFACSDDFNENSRIISFCQSRNILCNSATAPDEGNFIVPGAVRTNEMCVAISTNGASPLLTSRFCGELLEFCQGRDFFIEFMRRLRPLVVSVLPDQGHRAGFFKALLDSPFQKWLKTGNTNMCLEWLYANLPNHARNEVNKLFKRQ